METGDSITGLRWLPQETIAEFATVSLEVGAKFEDPVLLDLLTGFTYKLDDVQRSNGKTRIGSLPLADFPLVIAEGNEVVLLQT